MTAAEIYHSSRLVDCEQRAFVLRAVGIEHAIIPHGEHFLLLVPEELAPRALEHLRSYEDEMRDTQPARRHVHLHPNAWAGSLIYAVILIAVAWMAGEQAGGLNWLEVGALNARIVQSGEWWRLVTALTLHADLGHMLGNIAFGVIFGFFAAQLLGSGRAWASILTAAAIGNLLDSLLMPAQQQTIGASTAVFAMLGLVAAYSWRTGTLTARKWAHRWAPLVAGIALLGFTGTGGERTDVLAHLTGFFAGALAGIAHADLRVRLLDSGRVQIAAAVATIATIALAWSAGLSTVPH